MLYRHQGIVLAQGELRQVEQQKTQKKPRRILRARASIIYSQHLYTNTSPVGGRVAGAVSL